MDNSEQIHQIIMRALADKAFREKLRENPRKTLKSYGFNLSEDEISKIVKREKVC